MLALLLLLATTGDCGQIDITQAEASGFASGWHYRYSIDRDNDTTFHSKHGDNPKWLKLELAYLSYVDTISVVNR